MGAKDITDLAFGVRLQQHARNLAETIKGDPDLPEGVTVIVILARPPVHATWAQGPDHKELLKPVDQAAHEMSHELARKRA